MAKIRPFRALRPARELAPLIAALPYDVYSSAEARELVKDDPYSFLRIDRPETQFPPEQDPCSPEVYEKAAEMLREMTERGEFVSDESPCFYVYELTMNGRTQTGLVAASSVDDYVNGIIRRHENTRKEKEQDRIRHVDTCSAQTGPIFLAYRDDNRINRIIEKVKAGDPDVDFVRKDGTRHRVWPIADQSRLEELQSLFEGIPHTYIADGHHRAASAVAVSLKRREAYPDYTGDEEFNYFLSVLFPAGQLAIMDYNRVLKTLNGHTAEEILDAVRKVMNPVSCSAEPFHPRKKGEIGLLLDGCWYGFSVREEYRSDDPVENLDVAFLQREILSPVFGITDPTTDPMIDFVGGIRGLSELERRCRTDAKAAFCMYPTDIRELFSVADAGRLMPPKSTWFEPKLLSGLFIHLI